MCWLWESFSLASVGNEVVLFRVGSSIGKGALAEGTCSLRRGLIFGVDDMGSCALREKNTTFFSS